MNNLIIIAISGLIGGLARSFVGLIKHYRNNSKTKFKFGYMFITIIGAGIIGIFSSLLVSGNYFVPLIAGYAGIDIVESIAKAYKKKISWF